MSKTFLIEGIDPKLHKDFKVACAYYGLSMKDVLIQHMRNIVEDYLNEVSTLDKRISRIKKGGNKK